MPTSGYGCGTTYYGEYDRRPDGSFVATEWIIFCAIPLVPIRSCRLVITPGSVVQSGVVTTQSYPVLQKLPILWPQVLRIYATVLGSAAWIIGMGWFCFANFDANNYFTGSILMVLFTASLFVPFLLVRRARRSAFQKKYGAPAPPRW